MEEREREGLPPYYAAGTAQYHINADIAHAIRQYAETTHDRAFLHGPGAEMLVETARLWRSLGFFSERKGGRFEIHAVTGPDEYTTVVNNNTFTNLMARENLRYAATVVERLQAEDPERYEDLLHRTRLEQDEPAEWRRAAEKMHVPYDEELGINPQDDAFLRRERWDFAGTPKDEYPLLLHFHPLVIYRHQVIKQADMVLAMFLLNDEFSLEQKKRNFDYYDPLTTGDSSRSACIQAVIAMEVGPSRDPPPRRGDPPAAGPDGSAIGPAARAIRSRGRVRHHPRASRRRLSSAPGPSDAAGPAGAHGRYAHRVR